MILTKEERDELRKRYIRPAATPVTRDLPFQWLDNRIVDVFDAADSWERIAQARGALIEKYEKQVYDLLDTNERLVAELSVARTRVVTSKTDVAEDAQRLLTRGYW